MHDNSIEQRSMGLKTKVEFKNGQPDVDNPGHQQRVTLNLNEKFYTYGKRAHVHACGPVLCPPFQACCSVSHRSPAEYYSGIFGVSRSITRLLYRIMSS